METKYADIHADLIAKCKRQDRKAQHEIYKLYSKAMYNTACRILKDDEDAKDILQESFVDVFTKIESFRGDASFGAWFKRIVVNKSLNFLKKKKHILIDVSDVDVVEDTEVHHPTFDYQISDVQTATQKLPEGYRLVFDLYMFEGYSHREIAHELGISEATSKSQLSRAKVKLLTLLKTSTN